MSADSCCKKRKGRAERSGLAGMTTVEIVASALVFSLVSVVIISLFFATHVSLSDSITDVTLQDRAIKPMQAIMKELKEADPSSPISVSFPNGPGSIRFAVPSTTDASSITSWTQVDYDFNSTAGQITRTVGGQSAVVGRQISALTFSQLGNTITVSLTATGTTPEGKTLSTTLASQAAMRN